MKTNAPESLEQRAKPNTKPSRLAACSPAWLAAFAFLGVAMLWPGHSSAADLSLLGYRWENRSAVTYWIKAGGASTEAVADVLTAIDDWNEALADPVNGVPAAPVLVTASSSRKADIVIDLKPATGHNTFADIPILRSGESEPSLDGCKVVTEHLTLEGSALRDATRFAQTRNAARRLLGHALGLGDIVCPPNYLCGTSDIMDVGPSSYSLPDYDVLISPCDLFAISTIYNAQSCEDIPDSVPYTCN